jgi:hypothetical protein
MKEFFKFLNKAAQSFEPTAQALQPLRMAERQKVMGLFANETKISNSEMDPFRGELFARLDEFFEKISTAVHAQNFKKSFSADDYLPLILNLCGTMLQKYCEDNAVEINKLLDGWISYLQYAADALSYVDNLENRGEYQYKITMFTSALMYFRKEGLKEKVPNEGDRDYPHYQRLLVVAEKTIELYSKSEQPAVKDDTKYFPFLGRGMITLDEKGTSIISIDMERKHHLIQACKDYKKYLEDKIQASGNEVPLQNFVDPSSDLEEPELNDYQRRYIIVSQLQRDLSNDSQTPEQAIAGFVKKFNQHYDFLSKNPDQGWKAFVANCVAVLGAVIKHRSINAGKQAYQQFFKMEEIKKNEFLEQVQRTNIKLKR